MRHLLIDEMTNKCVIKIQTKIRNYLAKNKLYKIKLDKFKLIICIKIQSLIKGFIARKQYLIKKSL